jgi:hypothetical protein
MPGSPRGFEGSSLELFLLPKGLFIIMGMKKYIFIFIFIFIYLFLFIFCSF